MKNLEMNFVKYIQTPIVYFFLSSILLLGVVSLLILCIIPVIGSFILSCFLEDTLRENNWCCTNAQFASMLFGALHTIILLFIYLTFTSN